MFDSDIIPLAAQLRPTKLSDFVGQDHLLGVGKPLRKAIENQEKISFILWGPPGVGKTSLAKIYANALSTNLSEFSAVSAGKKDIKDFISSILPLDQTPVLFLDEVHRFTKAQQDFLLPYIENGTFIFIGATTENPSFRITSALLSRLRVFVLRSLSEEELKKIILKSQLAIDEESLNYVSNIAAGDARQALNIVEAVSRIHKQVTLKNIHETYEKKFLRYDHAGDQHFDCISAYIKSLRASQVDAALYYLARMVEGGEDPLYIARRMVVFASEDIGVAQATALVVANEVFRACETIGYPECAINLAHGTVYLATAKKSRQAYDGYFAALKDVQKHGSLPIPLQILNAPTKLMKDLGYHQGYNLYNRDNKSYLPELLKNKKYY